MAAWHLNPRGLILPTDYQEASPARPNLTEIATTLGGQDITRGYLAPNLLAPPDDAILLEANGGDYTLYRDLLRDDQVKAALEQRARAVIAAPWEVRPGGPKRIDKQAAEDLKQQLTDLHWDSATERMLSGVFYGFSVGELLYGTDQTRITFQIRVRDRRRFGFDGAGRLRLRTFQDTVGELLPDRKFWHFATGADHDDAPYGLGLAHWLYWPVWFKRNGIQFWGQLLEKWGTPTAIGQFPAGATPTEQKKFLYTLEAIQRNSALILPEGMTAQLLESKRTGTADHEAWVRLWNEAIQILVLGQTASTQGTKGKLGEEKLRGEVRDEIVRADADLICQSFNTGPAWWLTDWNFPGAAYPQVWRVLDNPEDLGQVADRDLKLFQIGYRPTPERIAQVYGEGYEPVTPPAPTSLSPPPTPQTGEPPAQFAESPSQDDGLDALIAEALADWQPVLTPVIDPIQQALDQSQAAGETAAQALARLAPLLIKLDPAELEQWLTQLAGMARLAGAAGAVP